MSITEIFPLAGHVATPLRQLLTPSLPALPAVAPGQLWFVELPETGVPPVSARHVLDAANVVIYDRALTDTVAAGLPLGSYAEPASSPNGAAARSVRFARDGWSVARLLPARLLPRERARRVQEIASELTAGNTARRLAVTIFAEDVNGIEERIETRLDDLAVIVSHYPRDTRLTIIVDALAGGAAWPALAGAANGLAG